MPDIPTTPQTSTIADTAAGAVDARRRDGAGDGRRDRASGSGPSPGPSP